MKPILKLALAGATLLTLTSCGNNPPDPNRVETPEDLAQVRQQQQEAYNQRRQETLQSQDQGQGQNQTTQPTTR